MTTPGSLSPRPSIYDVPPVAPQDMTAEEQEQWTAAQIASITLAAAATRKAITDSIVIQLVGMLRMINPYNEVAVTRFAVEAAALVGAGMSEAAQVAWAAVASRLQVQGEAIVAPYEPPDDDDLRTTDLAVAYKRVASDYRFRVSKGTESIRGSIAQAEEERFQAIGGAVVAQGRTGESNAEVAGTKRSPSSTGSSTGTPSTGTSGSATSGSGAATGASEGGHPAKTPTDQPVNETERDRDEPGAADQPGGPDAAAQDPAVVEAQLRREAALTPGEQDDLLEQVAQEEMEIRLERMVNDDMGMANRSAFRKAINAAPKKVIIGYRRVVHPELAESGQSCGLCIAASTRIYKKADLMPMHSLCNCEPVEVVKGQKDYGNQINEDDLDTLYGEAEYSTHRTDLSNTKWTVFDHPELGPVLRSVPRNKKREPVDISFGSRESASDRGGQ